MEFYEKNVNNPNLSYKYTCTDNHRSLDRSQVSHPTKTGFSSIETFFRNVFLPEGYPDSVSRDYVYYQIWDTVQAFASSISGSLATQAVLEGVGVGDETATPLAATLTWLMRHGAGMVGQIAFTWIEGSNLDHNCKKWRLFADILNDSALCLELSGPLWPDWCFQGVLCVAGVCRSLVGVAGGATRTAITQHQARSNNISDVAAKDGSQETLVNLAALVLNLAILPWLAGDKTLIWSLFFLLTILHLFANYKAVKCLHFNTLNEARLLDVLTGYIKNGTVSDPVITNENESVILGFGLTDLKSCGFRINLGSSLKTVCSKNMDCKKVLNQIQEALTKESFAIIQSKESIDIILSESCKSADYLRAYSSAFFKAHKMKSEEMSKKEFKELEEKLGEAGWNTSHLQVNSKGWVGSFKKNN